MFTSAARPMRRAVERYLEDPMAGKILRGDLNPGDDARIARACALLFSRPADKDEIAAACAFLGHARETHRLRQSGRRTRTRDLALLRPRPLPAQ